MPLTGSQSAAVSGRGNVIVVAGAGTGKTSTLVARCLDMVREGCSLDRVLMVTFTEAAAAEMRHRLRIELQKLADALDDAKEAAHFAEQLALIETARISTIHSFCLRLVRSHFHELEIDPEVKVLDEHRCRVLAEETLESLMKECCGGSELLHKSVQALITAYAPDRELLVRTWVLKLHNYTQSLSAGSAWIEQQQAAWVSDSTEQWEAWLITAFEEHCRSWLPRLQPHAGVENIDRCLEAMGATSGKLTRAQVAEAAGAIAEAGTSDWPKGTVGKVRNPLKECFEDARFLASVAGEGALEADWQMVQTHMRSLLALTAEFGTRFTRAKRELGGVDFPDLEQLTLRLLIDAEGQPSTEAREIQQQMDYVFVDECQDINSAQDAILSAISRTGAEANRFLVGDVKQSIYQFRLADPRLFRRYEDAWATGKAGQRISLTENFRSRPGILHFVNTLFGGLMRENFGGVSYEPLQPGEGSDMENRGEGPCVELHFILKATDTEAAPAEEAGEEIANLSTTEREAKLVVSRLRELKESGFVVWDKNEKCERAVEWRDMAVLMRSPGPRVETYAKAFHQAGIPLAASRGGFLEAIEVSDLMSLLKLLDNPLQDIPLLAVLRSPLVGLTLDELATIRVASEEKSFWRALRQFAANPHGAAGEAASQGDVDTRTQKGGGALELSACVSLFLDQFTRWRDLVRQVGPSMCLEQVLTDTSYDAMLGANERGVEQMANVRRLLEYARQFDPFRRQGLHRFLRFIQSLEDAEVSLEPAPGTSREAVQLMSIHRSKGLEFPVVALAGLGSTFNLQDLSSVILLDQEYGLAPKALTPSGAGRYPTLPFWLAEQRQRAQQLGEELRVWYVAATRARDHLILTGTMPRKDQGRWESAPESSVSDQDLMTARSPMDWLTAWLPGVTQDADWRDERHGASSVMQWELWEPQDERLRGSAGSEGVQEIEGTADAADAKAVIAVVERLSWQYAHQAATTEAAKSSVSALRSRALEWMDEDATHRFAGPRLKNRPASKPGKLSAAERGTLHHRFLERLQLEDTMDVQVLERQAGVLVEQGLFTPSEAAVLDLHRIAAFWNSDVGQRIQSAVPDIRRELPFTIRFDDAEVRSILGQPPNDALAGEFVVVQGVVDLAVVSNDNICLLDFKTDAVEGDALIARAEDYRPQLGLYAAALERIHGKPVRHQWLHFLAAGETVELGESPGVAGSLLV